MLTFDKKLKSSDNRLIQHTIYEHNTAICNKYILHCHCTYSLKNFKDKV